MNRDTVHRKYRFVEVLRSTDFGQIVQGWTATAQLLSPHSPKALLEGGYIATLPDGTSFKEISFKAEHSALEQALPQWSRHSGRRIAFIIDDHFRVSDGSSYLLEQIVFRPS
jgi:hypothetical protein